MCSAAASNTHRLRTVRDHKPIRSERLRGRSVLVFGGGSSGAIPNNGQAASVAYALAGATVTVVDLDLERAQATVSLIQAEGGGGIAVRGDVTKDEDVERAVETCREFAGKIDVLHNNVGVTDVEPTATLSVDRWSQSLHLNLTTCYRTIRAVLPIMLAQGAGVITNISSVAAIRYTKIPYLPYATAKAGLNQLTTCIALEYASRGVRANAILPGMMYTPLVFAQLARHYGDMTAATEERARQCPMGFMGDAWDVANAAVFLASDEARYITGQHLVVDGGLSMQLG